MKRVVITGGPCSGKSSLLKVLEQRKYLVVPETALYIIKREALKPVPCFPWTKPKKFHRKVFDLQKDWEKNAVSSGLVIFDRSCLDSLAYMIADKCEIPDLKKVNLDYNLVFMLQMLPENPFWYKTETGKPRKTNYEFGERMASLIALVYEQCHYKPIPIPFNGLNPSQRADLIEEKLLEHRII